MTILKKISFAVTFIACLSGCSQDKNLSIQELTVKAIEATEKGNYKDALNFYQMIKSKDSTFKKIDFMIGMNYYILNKKNLAFDLLTSAYRKDSNDMDPLYLRGQIYFEREQYHEAISDLSKFVLFNSNPHAKYVLGKSYLNVLKLDKALLNLNEAIEAHDKDSDWFHTRAIVYIMQEKYELALEDCYKAINLNNEDPGLYITRAMVYYSLKDNLRACRDYKQALALGFNNDNHPLKELCK